MNDTMNEKNNDNMTLNDIEDVYPMSDIEKGIIYHAEMDRSLYHIQEDFYLSEKDFDLDLFKKAFALMVEKHSILRSYYNLYDYDEPLHLVCSDIVLDILFEDISHLEKPQQDKFLNQYARDDAANPFDISSRKPLWRMRIFYLGSHQYCFIWVTHHAILDGWSSAALITELNNTYFTLKTNPDFVPEKLKSSYKEFVVEQMVEKESPVNARYWRQELEAYPRFDFYGASGKGSEENVKKSTVRRLDTRVKEQLEKVARSHRTNLKNICFAAYVYMLNMISRENDIVVGLVANSRPQCEDGEKIVGCFLNTVPVRIRIPDGITWSEYLQMVQEKMKELKRYDRMPLFDIARIIGEKAQGKNLIFDTSFNFIDFHIYKSVVKNEEAPEAESGYNKKDMALGVAAEINTNFDFNVSITSGIIIFGIAYDSSFVDDESVDRLLGYFEVIIDKFIYQASIPAAREDLIPREELNNIMHRFNQSETPWPQDKTLHQLFEEQVERVPQNIALMDDAGDRKLTYSDLNRSANQVALLLRGRGVEPDHLVAICADLSPDVVVGILAVLKAGGAYLPVDPDYPETRKNYLFRDSGAAILLTQSHLLEGDPCLKQHFCDDNIFLLDQILNENADASASNKSEPLNLHHVNTPHHLAYIIYTSGTTGKPKGAAIHHSGAVNYISWAAATYIKPGEQVTFPLYTSISFDLTVTSIFTPLLTGNSIAVYRGDSREIVIQRIIDDNRVNVIKATPAHLKAIRHNPVSGSVVKRFIVGGEELEAPLAADIHHLFGGNIEIYNEYGPTETVVGCMIHKFDPQTDTGKTVPIGSPVANTGIYILDHRLKPVPTGAVNQIYVSGDGVARGYLNRPELTRDRFVDSPFKQGEKMYKTGDLGRWLPNGVMEFFGRLDNQVKIRGYRIEPGEIQHCIAKHEKIKEAVVIIRDTTDGSGDKQLCAYIVPAVADVGGQLTPILKDYLSGQLPTYMIPAYFITIKKLPLTGNGKLDIAALPAPIAKSTVPYVGPRNKTDEALIPLWSEILGIEQEKIGVRDDFFQLGGHSLTATVMVARIHKAFDVQLPLADFFKFPSVAGLSDFINKTEKSVFQSIEPAEKRSRYPLSSAQKRLYILHVMNPENTAYIISGVIPLAESVQPELLEQTFLKLIQRHESLRTSFEMVNDEPMQHIHMDVPFNLEYYQFSTGDAEERETSTQETVNNFLRPMDVATAPLLRAGVLDNGEQSLLMVDIHHIISDGISQRLLIRDFLQLYDGETLTPLKLQYKDYTHWQNSIPYMESIKKQEEYWLDIYSDEIPTLNLPTDFPRPIEQSSAGSLHDFNIGPEYTEKFKTMCRRNHTTLFMNLLSILYVLLYKYSGQDDIIVGCDISGRHHEDLQGIVGVFINMLPIRCFPQGRLSFNQFAQEVKESSLNAFENQNMQFEELVGKLNLEKDTSRNPLFDVEFVHQNISVSSASSKDGGRKPIQGTVTTSIFDISLDATESLDDILLTARYCTALFKERTIHQFAGHYVNIFKSIVKNSDILISDIDILSKEQRKQILFQFNDTARDFPHQDTYAELFRQQVRQTPHRLAVRHNSQQYTYQELDRESDRLAHLLYFDQNIRPGKLVGILTHRSIHFAVAALAIFKAGGAYVPIDVDWPMERVNQLVEDGELSVLLSENRFRRRLELVQQKNKHLLAVLCLDGNTLYAGQPNLPETRFPQEYGPDDIAYVIYTSGTTGKPKGAMIHHRGMVNHIYAKIRDLDISDRDIIAQTASVAFDISVWQYFAPLLTGASVYIIDKDIILQHNMFLQLLQRKRITILESVPSLMKSFLHAIQHESNTRLGDLRWMIPTGESLPVSLVRQWFDIFPSIKLVNAYGPTEVSDDITHYIVDTRPTETQTGISIGRPLQNLQIYILDRDMALCPVGVRGEICVAGAGVGKGYWKNKEITDAAFIPNPFRNDAEADYNDTLYRTGDIGYYRGDGNIECLGRIDYQVKIRGFRIELGEIESRIEDYPDIKENVVIDRRDQGGNKYLCAYIAADEKIDISGLHNYLAKDLPDYMVPSQFMQLEKIPLTANGKINRKALPEPEVKPLADAVLPRNPVEEELARIWNEVLNRDPGSPPLGIDDDFFLMGGHSLRATMLASRIGRTMDVQVPLVEIFKTPTIRDLAIYISSSDITPDIMKDERLVPLKVERKNNKQIFLIHDITGEAEIFIELSKHGLAGYNIWGIRANRLENLMPRNVTIQQMAAEYIESIRKVQPHGPYYLLGWSFGGLIVYEMTDQLEQQNESVTFLGLVDSTPPNTEIENPVLDFTLESELAFIKRYFVGGVGARKYQLLKEKGLDQLWITVSDILEETGYDIDVKQTLFNLQRNPMIKYDHFTIRETLHYINVGRTLHNAHERYIPTSKIAAPLQYFKAADHVDTIDHTAWGALCSQPVNFHMVPGTHLSILRMPDVKEFSKIFDRALLEAEKN